MEASKWADSHSVEPNILHFFFVIFPTLSLSPLLSLENFPPFYLYCCSASLCSVLLAQCPLTALLKTHFPRNFLGVGKDSDRSWIPQIFLSLSLSHFKLLLHALLNLFSLLNLFLSLYSFPLYISSPVPFLSL